MNTGRTSRIVLIGIGLGLSTLMPESALAGTKPIWTPHQLSPKPPTLHTNQDGAFEDRSMPGPDGGETSIVDDRTTSRTLTGVLIDVLAVTPEGSLDVEDWSITTIASTPLPSLASAQDWAAGLAPSDTANRYEFGSLVPMSVPAPGVLALLALAGTRHRRRRR